MKINLNEGCYIINQSPKANLQTVEHLQAMTNPSKKVVRHKLSQAERIELKRCKSSFKRENPNYKHKVTAIFKAH